MNSYLRLFSHKFIDFNALITNIAFLRPNSNRTPRWLARQTCARGFYCANGFYYLNFFFDRSKNVQRTRSKG